MTLSVALRLLVFLVLIAAALFISAGRLDLPFFWAFSALLTVTCVLGALTMDPTLVHERAKPGAGGTDRALRFVILPVLLAHLVVAGLDVGRFRWSAIPPWVQVAAIALAAASYGVSVWAVRVNRFYSPVVRIQVERGHHLITDGPYRHIRHPGYLAALAIMFASGPALGSWWAILPNLLAVMLTLRRVTIEDRFLHHNLPGYPEYAGRVRYRLLPGVW